MDVDKGPALARCVDMFVLPASVVYAGTGQEFDHDLQLLDAEKPRLQHYWRELLLLYPSLQTTLQNSDMQGYVDITVALKKEGNKAKIYDLRRITCIIVDLWLAKDLEEAHVRLNSNNRWDRGFNNVVTGRYLCPIFMDYNDQSVRKRLSQRDFIGVYGYGGPPSFMFDLEKYDAAAPWKSFLRGRLIVLAWFYIFNAPVRHRGVGGGVPDVRPTVAKSHGMIRVTPGSITYAATMVHMALSATNSLAILRQSSEIRTMHEALVEFFTEPTNSDIVGDLLYWWNRLAFPAYASRTIPRVQTGHPHAPTRGFASS